MTRVRGALVGLVAALAACALAACALPSVAGAQLDPADSISLSLSAPSGHAYADYPFAFTGSGSVDGVDADDYAVQVLFTPSSSRILRGGCPSDFGATELAIEEQYGGPNAIAQYSQEGITNPFLLEQGGYTYTAPVNGDVVPTVTSAGSYTACAYLGSESSGDTFAVSRPMPFTVTDAPGTGTAPTGFGGPRGSREPSDLGLRVVARRQPIRAPGRNLLKVSGSFDVTDAPAGLVVTLKSTRRFNGCAANDDQDRQITEADGGVMLIRYEKVTASSSGAFSTPVALNFRRRFSGTAVVCAYLVDGFGDSLGVGYLRFSPRRPVARHKKATHRHR